VRRAAAAAAQHPHLRVDILMIGARDGRRSVLVRGGDTVGQLLDAVRPLFDVPLAARTLRHAHAGPQWERAQLADPELALEACGVRDGALLTVRADVRGGMEVDEDPTDGFAARARPPPSRVHCGLAAEGDALNVAAHVLTAIARYQREPDALDLAGAQSSTIFGQAAALEKGMQAPGCAPSIPRGCAFDDAARAVLDDAGEELRRAGDVRDLTSGVACYFGRPLTRRSQTAFTDCIHELQSPTATTNRMKMDHYSGNNGTLFRRNNGPFSGE
jgi:hypothetical protein